MPVKNQIVIASKYEPIAEAQIKASFAKTKAETQGLAREFDSLKRSVRATAAYNRKAIQESVTGITKDFDKQRKSSKKTATDYSDDSRRMRLSTKGLQADIGKYRNMLLLAAFAYQTLRRFILPAIRAYEMQEKAEIRLHYIMVTRNKETEFEYKLALQRAKGLQIVTGYGDEQIISMQANLETMKKLTREQKDRLIPLALDLARASETATGKEVALDRVMKTLLRTLQGSSRSLLELGVDIGNFKRGTMSTADVIKLLEDRIGGLGRETTNYSEILKGLRTDLGDTRESFGHMLTSFFGPAIETLAYYVKIKAAIKDYNELAKETGKKPLKMLEVDPRIGFVEKSFKDALAAGSAFIIPITKGLEIIAGKARDAGNELSWLEEREKEMVTIAGIHKTAMESLAGAKENLIKIQKKQQEIELAGLIQLKAEREALLKSLIKEKSLLIGTEKEWNKVDFYVEGISLLRKEIERLNKEIAELTGKLAEAPEDFLGIPKEDMQKIGTEVMTAYATGMRTALVDGFFNVIKGEFDSLSDIVVSFGDMMLKTILQAVANMALIKVGLGGFLGFTAHTGMYVMGDKTSAGYGRRKFHRGDEVDATLLTGEGVVNRQGMRNLGVDNLNKLNRGENVGGSIVVNNYYIDNIDAKSLRDRLMEHGDIYANASERGIKDNTSLRKTSQRFG